MQTTTEGSTTYVEPADRIAAFDQDGTTWVSHPLYGQGLFALDRLAELAPEHPEWKDTEPFKAVLTGDREAMAKFSEKDWMEIVAVTHAGMSLHRHRGRAGVRPGLCAGRLRHPARAGRGV